MEKGPRTTTFFALLFVFTFMSGRQKVGGTCRPCTQEAESTPICGSDQRTYSSRCLVQFARCKGHRVKIVHKGRCNDGKKIPLQVDNMVPASSACLRDRQQALSNAQTRDLIRLAVFVPKCEADGSYSQVQCLNTSHYCWCVDRLGRLIEGTRVRHSQPLCPVQTSQPSPTPVSKSWPVKSCVNCKGCPKDVRIKFNARIVELLSKEFMEDLQKASLENVSSHNKMGKVHLLLWKFTHLDTNADYVLEFKELQSFLKKTKKTIQPKKCSRTFMAYCDKDEDQKVSLNEWHVCFGVKEIKKCIGEYLAAVKASQRPSSLTQPYLPRCASDGSYYPTQCHYSFGYCWCVDVDSGKPIPNTTEKTSSLDCWQYTPFKNNSTDPGKKECALNLWTVFKRQLLRLFRREVEDDDLSRSLGNGSETTIRNSRSARSGDLPIHASFLSDNQVLIWKFNRLDRNRNKLLVPNEFLTPAMKKTLGKVKRGRKCSKKLINDCDLDKDKGLSLIEWTHCLRTSRRMPLQ